MQCTVILWRKSIPEGDVAERCTVSGSDIEEKSKNRVTEILQSHSVPAGNKHVDLNSAILYLKRSSDILKRLQLNSHRLDPALPLTVAELLRYCLIRCGRGCRAVNVTAVTEECKIVEDMYLLHLDWIEGHRTINVSDSHLAIASYYVSLKDYKAVRRFRVTLTHLTKVEGHSSVKIVMIHKF